MRCVFLSLGYYPDQVGGAYRYVTEVATCLASRGHEVRVIYPSADAASAPDEIRAGVKLARYPDQKGFFWNNWRRENLLAGARLKEILSDGEPTLVVTCHAFFANAVAGIPIVSLFTGPWAEEFSFSRQATPRPWWRQKLDALIASRLRNTEYQTLNRSQRILTISRYYEQFLPAWHPGLRPPVEVIFGGVDGRHFFPVPDRAKVRARFHLAEDDFLFLAVRRLDPRMGLLALVDAFAAASTDYPRARLYLAGKGPQAAALQARISALNLGQRIKLLGFVSDADLPLWYNAADCTVMPSLDLEGFGLATVESLACGTPVLGSNSGATPETLRPLDPNLIYASGSTTALTERLKGILQNPATLPSRQQCREYAAGRYNWNDVANAIEQCHAKMRS